MSKYLTRQRRTLLEYLSKHPDELLSAQEIAGALDGEAVSLSAVYRNLADLEAEGTVRQSRKSGSREIYFQYLNTEECRDRLHLSCTHCGKTFHMDAAEAEQIVNAVAKRDGFAIDRAETVLYGVCEKCQR